MTRHEIVLEALRTLNKPASLNEISAACGLSYQQVSNALSTLVRMEVVERVEKGVYQVVEDTTSQLPVKQHTLNLPASLPDRFPDPSQPREAAESFFSDQLKLWQLHKNIVEAAKTLSPYNLPLPIIVDPEEALLFVDAIQQYIYGTIEYTELLNQLKK